MSETSNERSKPQPKTERTVTSDRYDAVLLDLDGVITDTASIHAACWKQMFDEYLQKRARQRGEVFHPFEIATDYRLYVDGKPRYDGVRDFLTSRGIRLPEGSPNDPPQAETVDGLGNRKDNLVNKIIEEKGVEPYQGSVELIYQLRPAAVAGCRLAQAESSSLACASSYFGSMTRVIDFGNWPGACLSMGHERPQMTAEGASARRCPTGLNRHFRRFVSGLGKTRFPGNGD